ncbi:MAG: CehA/McbA family metallohydrolase [Armatimonadota bacterium]
MNNPFAQPGQWFKGNLHTHSNQSDGQPSPQQIVDEYAEHGYDFLSITDHWKLTDPSALDGQGLLLIPGSELNGGVAGLGQDYHLVVIGLREMIQHVEGMSIQDLIDAANAAGAFCWIAHPTWCSLSYTDLLPLTGTLGFEIYNTTCHRGIGRGESSVQYDELLARGLRPLALAVDDAHWHYPDDLGGWIMVKAAECTEEAILASMRQGNFYATSGPLIENVEFGEKTIKVTCSLAQELRLINPLPGQGATSHRVRGAGPFTEYEFPRPAHWEVCRLEVVDLQGRKAWTNAFWFA